MTVSDLYSRLLFQGDLCQDSRTAIAEFEHPVGSGRSLSSSAWRCS